MQQRRSPINYFLVMDYINKLRRPVFVYELHTYMIDKMQVNLAPARSRIIRRLIDLELIERFGKVNSRILIKRKVK